MATDYTAAETTNSLIVRLQPQDPTAWEERYWLLRYGATAPLEWTSIISLSDAALLTFPNAADWLGRRAEAQQWLNNPTAALADWEQVTVISPTNHGAWYQLGVARQALNDLAGARQAFETAAKFDGEQHLEYYVALALVYEQLELLEQAKATYRVAQRIAPKNKSLEQTLLRLGE